MLDATLASAMELSIGQKWIGSTWFYIAVIHTVLRQKNNGIGHFVANWKVCLINFSKNSGKKYHDANSSLYLHQKQQRQVRLSNKERNKTIK